MRTSPVRIIAKIVGDLRKEIPKSPVMKGVTAIEFALDSENVTVLFICNSAGVFPRTGIHPRMTLMYAKFEKWFFEKIEDGVHFEFGRFLSVKEKGVQVVFTVTEKGIRSRIRPKTLDYDAFEKCLVEISSRSGKVLIQREGQTDEEWNVVRTLADFHGKGKIILFE
jgi:hypothetical protein